MKKIKEIIEIVYLIVLCSGIVFFVVIAATFCALREMLWPTEEEKKWRQERKEHIKKCKEGYYGPME